MRATAYTHLVMNYGAVPIIENNLDHLVKPALRRNTVESVWEFILRDYEFAAENLLEEAPAEGEAERKPKPKPTPRPVPGVSMQPPEPDPAG